MKERPILFIGPMVRAILEGRKTVTRRALSDRVLRNIGFGVQLGECHELPAPADGDLHPNSVDYYNAFCPYGQPGDRLWVRETWYCDHFEVQRGPYLKPANLNIEDAREHGYLVYAADGLTPYEAEQPTWKPSIHMPRWACRILLEITDVRVERLQDISDQQAVAEGIDLDQLADAQGRYDMVADHNMTGRPTATGAFCDLWASINGIESWEANPWVWVVEFKRAGF